MKTYESAALVDLGNAKELVLGVAGRGPDDPIFDNDLLDDATVADVDE